jgi:hypothetical protein
MSSDRISKEDINVSQTEKKNVTKSLRNDGKIRFCAILTGLDVPNTGKDDDDNDIFGSRSHLFLLLLMTSILT